MSDNLQKHREYMQRKKAEAIAAGNCSVCWKKPQSFRKKLCPDCATKLRLRRQRDLAKAKQENRCQVCGAVFLGWQKSCADCRAKAKKRQQHRGKNGICAMCHLYAVRGTQLCMHHRAVRQFYHRAERRKLRAAAFVAYGGPVCVCCGESRVDFLHIDHIDGGGNRHRKEIAGGCRSGQPFYAWLRRNNFPPGFRVLCANCNLARGCYGECPHQRELRGLIGGDGI